MQLTAIASGNGAACTTLYANCMEGYAFTAQSALFFVESLLAHKIMPGAYTPAQAVEPKELIDMLDITITPA